VLSHCEGLAGPLVGVRRPASCPAHGRADCLYMRAGGIWSSTASRSRPVGHLSRLKQQTSRPSLGARFEPRLEKFAIHHLGKGSGDVSNLAVTPLGKLLKFLAVVADK